MTPVFDEGKVVFFVASRGHHADIGGISPGSMPPLSKHLFEEGAATKSFKLVKAGEFQEAGITEILMGNSPPLRVVFLQPSQLFWFFRLSCSVIFT